MSPETILPLLVSGLTNGAIYALLGLGLVLIYGVTRVVNIAQGEFVTLGALTTVSLIAGRTPATIGLTLAAAALALALEVGRRFGTARGLLALALTAAVAFLLNLGASRLLDGHPVPYGLATPLAVLVVAAFGSLVCRVLINTTPEGSEGLIYMIITTGLFIALEGFSLVFWGSQGNQLPPVVDGSVVLGGVPVRYQSFFVMANVALLLAALWAYFERSLEGKALRATAINRTGARLVGISPFRAGLIAWGVSAGLSALGGVLIAPIIIVNYDIGLPLGLKGFIGAVIGGMVSYPGAVAGGLLVGVLESFAGYANSAYREVIVYSLLFLILVYRAVRSSTRRGSRRARPARGLA